MLHDKVIRSIIFIIVIISIMLIIIIILIILSKKYIVGIKEIYNCALKSV